ADSPRFIQTVPRRGYRFVAPVERVPPPASEAPPISPSPAPAPAVSARATWISPAALAGILLATGLLSVAAWRLVPKTAPAPSRLVIAALPFEDLTGDSRSALFIQGLTDELIASFGALQPARLGIIARTSVTRAASAHSSAGQIGRDLGVGHIVEGSI